MKLLYMPSPPTFLNSFLQTLIFQNNEIGILVQKMIKYFFLLRAGRSQFVIVRIPLHHFFGWVLK